LNPVSGPKLKPLPGSLLDLDPPSGEARRKKVRKDQFLNYFEGVLFKLHLGKQFCIAQCLSQCQKQCEKFVKFLMNLCL
jgi:hypothetical protein